jgi:SAM-dependent methyltransferase
VGAYDDLADEYDGRYTRPIDRWEDERLVELLAPYVNGEDVLDLGCGTGWVLDNLAPTGYLGVDESAAMLAELTRKHPDADVVKSSVGERAWAEQLPGRRWPVIVATWSADFFLPLDRVLWVLQQLAQPRGIVALHGHQRRGWQRSHCADIGVEYHGRFTPRRVRSSGHEAGLGPARSWGTGATPDALARSRWMWRAGLAAPVGWHYAALHVWGDL